MHSFGQCRVVAIMRRRHVSGADLMLAQAANAQSVRHPVLELLARCLEVLKEAWARRHELAEPKRLADEAAFLPAARSLQDTPVHSAPRRFACVLNFIDL